MAAAPAKAGNRDGLALLTLPKTGHNRRDDIGREQRIIDRVEHEGGSARDLAQGCQQRRELSGAPPGIDDHTNASRNNLFELLAPAAENYDGWLQAGAVVNGDL